MIPLGKQHNRTTERRSLVTAALLGVGITLCSWGLLGFEWIAPNCGIPTEGPAYTYWGFPFPAYHFTGAFSGAYDVAPLLLFANLIAQSTVFGVLLFLLTRRVEKIRSLVSSVGRTVGATLTIIGGLFVVLFFSWGPSRAQLLPVASYESFSYLDLRPIGPRTSLRDHCTPSDYWYPHPLPPPPPDIASLKCHARFSAWSFREVERNGRSATRTAIIAPLAQEGSSEQGCLPGLVQLVIQEGGRETGRFELEARYYFAGGIGLFLRHDVAASPQALPAPLARIYLTKNYRKVRQLLVESGFDSIRPGRFECEQKKECLLAEGE